jgi:hypothetical protein
MNMRRISMFLAFNSFHFSTILYYYKVSKSFNLNIMVDSYEFGEIVIDGAKYTEDVLIFDSKVKEWWREEGHSVSVNDLSDLPLDDIDYFVMGNGASSQCAFPGKTKKFLEDKEIKVIVESTDKAYKTYNKLKQEGKNAAAGFHLTC